MSISSQQRTGHLFTHSAILSLSISIATPRLELIDDAMLRPGRLGKLLYVPLPSASDRSSILTAICRSEFPLPPRILLIIQLRKVSIDSENVNFEAIASDQRAEGHYPPLYSVVSLIFLHRFFRCRFSCLGS
jgi:SpoVK/Ycf46/Vps4 family AAA+-type ATPase